jgi:predicted aspartyl protease
VARIEGTITEDDKILIDGYLFKDNIKIETSFVIDTGFIGYDLAIPADVAERLNLNPSRTVSVTTAAGTVELKTGEDLYIILGNKTYKVSYIIYYGSINLISISFLKRISEIIIIDFINRHVTIILL